MAATCKLMSGFETLDLTSGGYAFRVPSPGSWDTETNVQKRAYGAGGVEISDKTLKSLILWVEGYIISTTAAGHEALWKALTNFLRNKTSLRLFFDDNAYYKIDQAVAFDPVFPPGSGHRGNQIKIKLSITDPYIYTYEPAYLLRFGNPYLWTEGRGNVYPEAGFVITHRRDGIGGMDDYSVAVDEATTNLCTNNQASVETDTTGFTAVNAGVLTRVLTEYFYGAASLRCVTPNMLAGEGFYIGIGAVAAVAHTGSIYVKGTGDLQIYLRDITNGTNGVSQTITLTSNWTRYHCHHTAGAACADFRLYIVTTGLQGITFYYDGGQVEALNYPTSWTAGGTSRIEGDLEYDILDGVLETGEMTLSFRFQPFNTWSPCALTAYLARWGIGITYGFVIRTNSATGAINFITYGGVGGQINWTPTGDGPFTLCFTINWNNGTMGFYVNGASVGSASGLTLLQPYGGENLCLQAVAAGSSPRGMYDNIVLLDRLATATEIAAFHSSFSATFPRRGFLAHFHDAVNEETTPGSFTVNNPELFDTPATIRLAAQETVPSVTVVNTSDPRTFTYAEPAFVNGQTTVIDGVGGGTALRGSTNVINYMQGLFLRLMEGNNAFTFQGHDTEVSVLFEARWI